MSNMSWREWKKAVCQAGKTTYRRFFYPYFSMKHCGGAEAWKDLWREGIQPDEAMRDEVSYMMEG